MSLVSVSVSKEVIIEQRLSEMEGIMQRSWKRTFEQREEHEQRPAWGVEGWSKGAGREGETEDEDREIIGVKSL